MQVIGFQWFPHQLWVFTFTTENFVFVCNTGWVFLSLTLLLVLFVGLILTVMGITRSHAEVMGTSSIVTILWGTSYTLQLALLHWHLERRFLSSAGHALSVGEYRKVRAHFLSCRSTGISFIPLVVETFGGWSDRAIRVIRRLGKLQGSRLGVDQAMATRHLFQRLSVSLWRGNANLWASRLPFFSPSVDGIRWLCSSAPPPFLCFCVLFCFFCFPSNLWFSFFSFPSCSFFFSPLVIILWIVTI